MSVPPNANTNAIAAHIIPMGDDLALVRFRDIGAVIVGPPCLMVLLFHWRNGILIRSTIRIIIYCIAFDIRY